ncbi:Os03g0374500 [Oryza sativa Japonica Group]|uniref:Os03g0374500 protein n=1 Tax=Oryza sativa subsp. japonica TaxID=39947 RepID=C7IZX6_ORYSJ|nr:Os03g0374500 [Oryza sativa Japonica Group]|eukprot:NP_001173441.1 Os03g0374500 [Oryza sativa Japonica Group]
MDTPMASID